MLFGLDGVEIGLIIVFLMLFGSILSGFPVAFAIGGSAILSFGVIAGLDQAGLLIHQAIDTGSAEYAAILAEGIKADKISVFNYPELPRVETPVFPQGWETALDRNVSFIVNRINERVLAGQSIETLLAVLMFVLMGITLERSKIANDLLMTMARVFGPLPGGLAVSIVVVGAFLAASTGIVGATVVTMGLLALPTMLRNHYSPELATGVIAASGTLGQIIPPSIVIVLLGTLAGDIYSAAQEERAQLAGCTDALTYLGEPAVVSVGTLFQAALIPGIMLAFLYAAYAFTYALLNPSKAPAVQMGTASSEVITRNEALTWFLAAPVILVGGLIFLSSAGVVGSQNVQVNTFSDAGERASLRTNVGEECQASMIALHGQAAWDQAVAETKAIQEAGGLQESVELTEEEQAARLAGKPGQCGPAGQWPGCGCGSAGLGHHNRHGRFPKRGPKAALDRPGRRLCRLSGGRLPRLTFDLTRNDAGSDRLTPCRGPLVLSPCGRADGPERAFARRLPAPGADRRGAWLDPWRHHQPDARRRPRRWWRDHAGRLP